MHSRGIVLLGDNARLHAAAAMQGLIIKFAWEQFDHHICSPALVPGDFHLFLCHKKFLGGISIMITASTKKKKQP